MKFEKISCCKTCGEFESNDVEVATPFTCFMCGKIEFPYIPLKNIIYIFPDPLPEKMGSFYVPSLYAENLRQKFGTVLAVGKGYYDKEGRYNPTTVKPGDRVIFDIDAPWYDTIVGLDGKSHRVRYMPELDVKGIVLE